MRQNRLICALTTRRLSCSGPQSSGLTLQGGRFGSRCPIQHNSLLGGVLRSRGVGCPRLPDTAMRITRLTTEEGGSAGGLLHQERPPRKEHCKVRHHPQVIQGGSAHAAGPPAVTETRRATAPAAPSPPGGKWPACDRSASRTTGWNSPGAPSSRQCRARSGPPPTRPRCGSPPG